MIAAWPCANGGSEYALAWEMERDHRLLIIPALFDESNKLRHLTVEIMRRLAHEGIDSFLPDLPGQNESRAPIEEQSLETWRVEASAAAAHFRATHVLSVRGGALLAPDLLPGLAYAPVTGETILRSLLRARILTSREAGEHERREDLLARGREEGLELAGYRLGPAMIRQLEQAEPSDLHLPIAQSEVGGAGLWLRAEPDFDADQASALAALIIGRLA